MIFKKEKEVIGMIIKYLDVAQECLLSAENAIQSYINDNIKDAKALARKTRELESEADLIRYEIRDKLYSGAYLPLLRRISINWSRASTRWPMPLKPVAIFF